MTTSVLNTLITHSVNVGVYLAQLLDVAHLLLLQQLHLALVLRQTPPLLIATTHLVHNAALQSLQRYRLVPAHRLHEKKNPNRHNRLLPNTLFTFLNFGKFVNYILLNMSLQMSTPVIGTVDDNTIRFSLKFKHNKLSLC